jgi:hydrogenase expression/formation protein HypD
VDLSGFRDPEIAKGLIDSIAATAAKIGREVKIMEVCGTHTVAIAKNGLRAVMPENVTLLSGPGCPVCVTANEDIDLAIEFAKRPDTIVTTFGDMMKVPGSYSSLSREKADGRDVRIVYSPLDALALAAKEPDKQVVFIAVGFETTIPLIAASIHRAQEQGLTNFSVFSAHKTVPKALEALVNDPEVQIDAFILPGHVSTIIGTEPYRFIAEQYHVPGVVTGFEPVDVLKGVYMLLKQLEEGRSEIENGYPRGVSEHGNEVAWALVEEYFMPVAADWRGIGVIPDTGLGLRPEYDAYNALVKLPVTPPEPKQIKGCQCGDVLRGVILPYQCRLFSKACTPEHPIGPCMVSSEGSCAAYYRFTDYGKA